MINTTPFQNPRSEPIAPTASRSGYDSWPGLMKAEMRLIVGASQVASSAMKNISGMNTYSLNDTCLGGLWSKVILLDGCRWEVEI